FAGKSRHRDLKPVRVGEATLAESANFQLLAAGLVYPTFYSQLYPDLRASMTAATEKARSAGTGIWARDVTNSAAKVSAMDALRDDLVILPKLFRRLVDYLALGAGSVSLDGFTDFLATRNDRVIVIPDGHVTGLDNLIRVDGETVTLEQRPEDLVFM